MVPFVLSVVQVVETLLQPLQLQGEARSQFLKLDVLCVIENVSAIKAATIKEKSEEKKIMFGLQCNQGTKGKREEKKNGPVKSNKDEVSLVVEGDDLPPFELRIVRKQRSKHSSHTVTQACVESIQNELRTVLRNLSTVL